MLLMYFQEYQDELGHSGVDSFNKNFLNFSLITVCHYTPNTGTTSPLKNINTIVFKTMPVKFCDKVMLTNKHII